MIVKPSPEELKVILAEHGRWLAGESDGKRMNLIRADLSGADLSGADLIRADLQRVREDFFTVLAAVPNEVPGLLAALQAGKINGQVYSGECACLVGTVANVRGCQLSMSGFGLKELQPDPSRPAERWFMHLSPGHTPAISQVARITEGWILEWMAVHPLPAEVAAPVVVLP